MGVRRVAYGAELLENSESGRSGGSGGGAKSSGLSGEALYAAKALLAPVMAATIESMVANRAEAQV